jgi:DNA-binding MarR family transcriptional regulator
MQGKVYILLIMSEQTERDRLAFIAKTCAGINLRRASRAITHYYDRLLVEACDLRATQIPPLIALYLAGSQTINEMADRLELDRTTLTRNLKPLQVRGLLTIEPGTDQRTRRVTLTRRGASTLLKALPVWEQAQARVVQGIGEERYRTLLAQLANIRALAPKE